MTETIRLNGQVVEWNDRNDDEFLIKPAEVEQYEREGWTVINIGLGPYAVRFDTGFPDGTIQLQQKSDERGRMAAKGGHTNWGFSGYFKGYVYLGGKRKKIVDWWTLFPNKEHHFARQQDTPDTIGKIRAIVEPLAGTEAVKTKGGYTIKP